MDPSRTLRYARRHAGITQRALATRAGVPQATVARIELALVDPRASTLQRLLTACDMALAVSSSNSGVDVWQIRRNLAMSPAARLAYAARGARNVRELVSATKK